MNKKIVFISNYFGNGGAANVIKTLAQNFSEKQGYDVTIVAMQDDEKKYTVPSNVKFICIDNNFKFKPIKKIFRILKLRKILKKEKCSIISFEYFINMQTILANFGLKNKLVISERNDPARVGHKKRKARNFLYKFADSLVCQTPDAKNYFPENIQKISTIIPNPINDNLPEPWNGERKKEIVNYCRLEKQKNLPMLVDAFEIVHEKYPDYTLSIYGDGNEENSLKDYIKVKRLEKYIKIHPAVKNIHEKVLKSKMFVSSSNYEGLSNSMIESMAIGLPTICTDCPCGGAKMMIKHGENGLLVPVGDCKELSNTIIKLIENDKLYEKISNNGKKIREKLDSQKICSEWQNLI